MTRPMSGKIIFRPQRATLAESLRDAVVLDGTDALADYLTESYRLSTESRRIRRESIRFVHPHDDPRCGWTNVFLVTVDEAGVGYVCNLENVATSTALFDRGEASEYAGASARSIPHARDGAVDGYREQAPNEPNDDNGQDDARAAVDVEQPDEFDVAETRHVAVIDIASHDAPRSTLGGKLEYGLFANVRVRFGELCASGDGPPRLCDVVTVDGVLTPTEEGALYAEWHRQFGAPLFDPPKPKSQSFDPTWNTLSNDESWATYIRQMRDHINASTADYIREAARRRHYSHVGFDPATGDAETVVHFAFDFGFDPPGDEPL